MSKYLLIPNTNNKTYFLNYKFDGFILPLKSFSVGFDYNFNIKEINEISTKFNTYVLINKYLHSKEIEKIKKTLNMLHNIKGFFIDDIGLTNCIEKDKIIFYKNHFINNYDAITYLNTLGINNVVISNELTKKEIKQIRNNTKSKLFYFLINRNTLMYSKRKLLSNYYKNYNYKEKLYNTFIEEKTSKRKLYIKEEKEETLIFDGKIFMGEDLKLDYYIININNMNENIRNKVLNNYRNKINDLEKDDYFLNNEIGYKVKRNE